MIVKQYEGQAAHFKTIFRNCFHCDLYSVFSLVTYLQLLSHRSYQVPISSSVYSTLGIVSPLETNRYIKKSKFFAFTNGCLRNI